MRNISFALTTRQFLDGTKDVTRRLGWASLKPGDTLAACEKCMGLKKGERPVKLGIVRVVAVRRERLDAIDQPDVIREGFPEMSPAEFVAMFTSHMRCEPSIEVTRIEFQRINPKEANT
jgi:hypothetical protein